MTYSNIWVEGPKNCSTYFVHIETTLFDRFFYWTLKLQELMEILISGSCGRISIVSHKLMSSLTGQIFIADYQ